MAQSVISRPQYPDAYSYPNQAYAAQPYPSPEASIYPAFQSYVPYQAYLAPTQDHQAEEMTDNQHENFKEARNSQLSVAAPSENTYNGNSIRPSTTSYMEPEVDQMPFIAQIPEEPPHVPKP